MNSPSKTTKNDLTAQLQQIGLRALPQNLDDFLARASKARWSSHMLLEELCRSELQERSHRSLERRLRLSAIKSFKPLADFEWNWPTKIDRDVIERALTLDFLLQARNLVLVGRNGLGKTLIAKNICHAAVLAGHSVLFRTAPAILEDLQSEFLLGYGFFNSFSLDEARESGMPIHVDGVLVHALPGTELSRVRTELDPFCIFPTVPPHPVHPNRQSSGHGHLGDVPLPTHR